MGSSLNLQNFTDNMRTNIVYLLLLLVLFLAHYPADIEAQSCIRKGQSCTTSNECCRRHVCRNSFNIGAQGDKVCKKKYKKCSLPGEACGTGRRINRCCKAGFPPETNTCQGG